MAKGIDLQSLTVGYKNPVIEQATFTVEQGDIVALIGPNGAGKSTVLKTIVRQIQKLEGKVFVLGNDEENLSEEDLAKTLSMVTTEPVRPELMSAYEVVATGRYPYTGRLGLLAKEDLERVEEAIKLVGAKNVADKDFMKISDGQKQRVMLARAICQEPKVLILDEPTSFLDIQFKIDILSVIKRLAREKNIAVLMSIHELEFVPAVADYVVAVDGGKVVKIGKPNEVITGPQIEEIYHMKKGTGAPLVESMWQYAKGLESILKSK
ncbi:MAG: ABC transporter ATP-binding protein [Pseudobutyrivibrio sp.]|nr:ABC transporter ATP-binding protein [Pseudobutyrivibrio sp.]